MLIGAVELKNSLPTLWLLSFITPPVWFSKRVFARALDVDAFITLARFYADELLAPLTTPLLMFSCDYSLNAKLLSPPTPARIASLCYVDMPIRPLFEAFPRADTAFLVVFSLLEAREACCLTKFWTKVYVFISWFELPISLLLLWLLL